ncbi:MAG TPA: bifunctional riboflavin kinase/FAD synthetase [Pirellulaceae bacterium]|nr:bifunctional riboflavin kinase/FAD synthetase [Pirellulaceae bacterium]
MRLLRSLDNLPADLRRGAVTIGNFDGVHRGHARLVERLLAKAREVGGPAIVFTFDPHPVRLLRPESAPPPLTWTDRKAQLLDELGVTAVIAYPTDEALLALSAEAFFAKIVLEQLAARAMVEGPNFYFGRGRAGNVESLQQLCSRSSVALEIVPPIGVGDQLVSSSRVRDAISAGDIDLARQLLTRPYRVRGMVTHGAGRGAKIGFPTANLEAIDTLLPAQGVYAARAIAPAGVWPAAVNIGPNPTFGEHALKVEAHLIDFSGPLYGQPLELDFLSRLRSVRPFESVAALKSQLAHDVAAAREFASRDATAEEDTVG